MQIGDSKLTSAVNECERLFELVTLFRARPTSHLKAAGVDFPRGKKWSMDGWMGIVTRVQSLVSAKV